MGEVDLEAPADGCVLIRVSAVGLCGSDAHWYNEQSIGDSTLDGKLILGHEFAGVIEFGPRAGERVAGDPAIPCLDCVQCRTRRHNLCTNMRFAGHEGTDGALRRHLLWPERCLVPLPDPVPDAVGALLEPLGVALHAIDLAYLDPSQTAAVIGCGPIGLLLVFALRAMGVTRIRATDPLSHRRQAAGQLGATIGDVGALRNAADVVFDAAGTDVALADAMVAATPGGRVVVVGIPDGDRNRLTASMARRKELTMVWCRRMLPGDLALAAALAADHTATLHDLVSHTYVLGDTDKAFETLIDRRGLKVLVTPDGT